MQIVDSAESTARVVKQMIEENLNCHPERSQKTPIIEGTPSAHRTFRFYVTDSVDKFKRLATRFLGRQVDNVEHVDLGG